MKTLDDFAQASVSHWQNQRMWELVNQASILNRLFPQPPSKPLTRRERMALELRIRARRLRDALKVLRGEAEISEGYDE